MLHTTQGIAGLFLVSHGWVVNAGKVRAAAGGSTTHGAPVQALCRDHIGAPPLPKRVIPVALHDLW